MKIKLLIVLGLVFAAGFIFFKIPAEAILNHGKIKQAGISAQKVKGTFWSGQAQNVKLRNINLEQVNWEMLPSAIANLGSLANINVKQGDSSLAAKVVGFGNGAELKDIKGEVKITDLIEAVRKYRKILIPIAVDGTILVDLSNLNVNKNNQLQSINGHVVLKALAVAGQNLRGDYTAEIKTADKIIEFVIYSTNGSDLALSGKGSFSPKGQYTFSGKLGATTQTPEEILSLLKMIGINDKKKTIDFQRQGKLQY